jgi:MSHA biogenesis protein MshO
MYKNIRGFTLIEAVIVITITGILAAACAVFMVGPITAYVVNARRAELVSVASASLERMVRDIRLAVPNSIRVKPAPGNNAAIEFVPAIESVRYQASGVGSYLSFAQTNSTFNIEGVFSQNVTSAVASGDSFSLVVYNQASTTVGGTSDNPLAGVNLYNSTLNAGVYPPAGTHVITPSTTAITFNTVGTNSITMTPAFQFAFASPSQRLYIVDMTQAPISYVCDTTQNTITRYWNYAIQAVQPNDPSTSPLNLGTTQNAKLSDHIVSCSFSYAPGTSERAAVVTISLGLQDASGDNITLLRQVHVTNAP